MFDNMMSFLVEENDGIVLYTASACILRSTISMNARNRPLADDSQTTETCPEK